MKTRLLCFLLAAMLAVPAMTGCRAAQKVESAAGSVEQGAQSLGESVEQGIEIAGNELMQTTGTTAAAVSGKPANPALTFEEAQSIALKHAGFSADQVTGLRAEYEIERGIPQYDVEFRRGNWEYDYEIHGNTGEILSYSRDD